MAESIRLSDRERDLILLALLKSANGDAEVGELLHRLSAPHMTLHLHGDRRREKAAARRVVAEA